VNFRFPPRPSFSLSLPHGGILSVGPRTLVMGVLNVTPDSFGDAIRLTPATIVETARQMEAAGADLLDVGGESTRPGAAPVDADEELRRVVPAIRALAAAVRVPISIDTYKGAVARAAIEAGASLVNDISGLQYDSSLGTTVAACGAPVILMHTRGRSAEMYADARYTDVVAEVIIELREALDRAVAAGVPLEQTIVDPGIGFAKRPEHSYGVLARLSEIGAAIGRPVLVGPSRKSFLNAAVGSRPAAARDWGTAAAVTASVLAGAHIVRVHAVAEMAQVVRVADEIRTHG
jgi:dihydropteroate synthase